jgi:hypothetical protein
MENKTQLVEYDKIEHEIKRLKKESTAIKAEVCSQIFSDNTTPIVYNLQDSVIGKPSAFRFSQIERPQAFSQDTLGNSLLKFFDTANLDEFNALSNAQKATTICNFITNKDNRNKKLIYTVRRIDYVECS